MVRSVTSIDDLTNDEIEEIFLLADRLLVEMSTTGKPYRIAGRSSLAEGLILATLFLEPSTRTRLSFESAMLRLGGQCISVADADSTSAFKGETIADTVRVVENYADAIVIRHPYEGAARVAAQYTDVPVINAGDGAHEHPTQTLCDLYTLREAKKAEAKKAGRDVPGIKALRDLNVVLWGDLQHGRTVHSLVYALARFGARIIPLAAPGREFPDHVCRRLARDYNCLPLSAKDIDALPGEKLPADVLYVTPDEPHQQALFANAWFALSAKQQAEIRTMRSVDAVYSTRLQRERLDSGEELVDYPVVDARFLKDRLYRHAQVMHPLPRVDELSYELDTDRRGVYFKQAAYGVPVRMALLASLLELAPEILRGEGPAQRYPLYAHPSGMGCDNRRCVTSQVSEQRYLTPHFSMVSTEPVTLRCQYCDYEQMPQVVSRASTKKYTAKMTDWQRVPLDDLVLFVDEDQAIQAGHERKKTPRRDSTADRSSEDSTASGVTG